MSKLQLWKDSLGEAHANSRQNWDSKSKVLEDLPDDESDPYDFQSIVL
jgi:hypothetical protein